MAGWGQAAAAGIQALSSMAGNLFSASQAKKEAKKARDFTKKMMKSRHQWEVGDLRKAGLNPILSAGGTPSMGSSAMAQIPTMQGIDVAGAMEAYTSAADIKQKKARNKSKTWEQFANETHAEESVNTMRAQRELLDAQKANVNANTARQVFENVGHEIDAQIDSSSYGVLMRKTKRLTDQVPPVGLGALIGGKRGRKKFERKGRIPERNPRPMGINRQ